MPFETMLSTLKKFKQSGKETDKDNFKYVKLSLKKIVNNKKKLYCEDKIKKIRRIIKNSGEL